MLARLRRFWIALQIHTDFGIDWERSRTMADHRISWRESHGQKA